MTEPRLSVDAAAKAELLDGSQWFGSAVVGILTGILGYVVGVIVRPFWPVSVAGLTTPETVAVAGFVLPVVLFVFGSALNMVGAGFEFYRDRVVRSGGLLAREEVPYEGVAFAVRMESGGDARSGAADFRLFREDEEDDRLRNVTNPDGVQAVLDEHLPSPEEWLAGRDERDTAFRAFVRHRTEMGGDDEPGAVYDRETLEDLFGFGPGDLRLEELQSIDGVEDIDDIDTTDLRPNVTREDAPDPGV